MVGSHGLTWPDMAMAMMKPSQLDGVAMPWVMDIETIGWRRYHTQLGTRRYLGALTYLVFTERGQSGIGRKVCAAVITKL